MDASKISQLFVVHINDKNVQLFKFQYNEQHKATINSHRRPYRAVGSQRLYMVLN